VFTFRYRRAGSSGGDIGQDGAVRIRALSVFEGVVYHCWPVDLHHPDRPTLEVDAVLRAGDADDGPLLVTVSDFATMVADPLVARHSVEVLRVRGRVVRWLDVDHISFPLWTRLTGPDAQSDPPDEMPNPGEPQHRANPPHLRAVPPRP